MLKISFILGIFILLTGPSFYGESNEFDGILTEETLKRWEFQTQDINLDLSNWNMKSIENKVLKSNR